VWEAEFRELLAEAVSLDESEDSRDGLVLGENEGVTRPGRGGGAQDAVTMGERAVVKSGDRGESAQEALTIGGHVLVDSGGHGEGAQHAPTRGESALVKSDARDVFLHGREETRVQKCSGEQNGKSAGHAVQPCGPGVQVRAPAQPLPSSAAGMAAQGNQGQDTLVQATRMAAPEAAQAAVPEVTPPEGAAHAGVPDMAKPPKTAEQASLPEQTKPPKTAEQASLSDAPEQALPLGWVAFATDDEDAVGAGLVYYFHEASGVTTWDRPRK